MSLVEKFYTEGEFFRNNPDWDRQDTNWKLQKISPILEKYLNTVSSRSICEIGCGSADLLKRLALLYPQHQFYGWDISPHASLFWKDAPPNLHLRTGDFFLSSAIEQYDLIILLDVIEHVADPLTFLSNLKKYSRLILLHIPLDLSAVSAFFDQKLLHVRKSVGHIHYYTYQLALSLLEEAGLEIISSQLSNAWIDSPHRSKNIFAQAIKYLIYQIFGKRAPNLIGGQTLFVLCQTPKIHV